MRLLNVSQMGWAEDTNCEIIPNALNFSYEI